MKPNELIPILQRQLDTAGFSASSPQPSLAWHVFRQAASTSVECMSDRLLFQVGKLGDTQSGYFDFCREFRLAAEDGSVWYEQVHFEFVPTVPMISPERSITRWSSDFPDTDAFFLWVESLPQFPAWAGICAWRFTLYHTGV